MNVNTRMPNAPGSLSLQDITHLEPDYPFDMASKFRTNLSLVYRFSAAGEPGGIIDHLFDAIFDCFLGFTVTCDDKDTTVKNAKFIPYNLQTIPFFKNEIS